ncbi:uncharacterized protein LOC118193654 [Stegodyphus dumicola]|uniref:uncharacterized protein LOC118193654 n=1 Tax=Stegodyphus dumicola TaxID=202533 RepID=UPI0015AA39A9|nr:uncharacterized protein LOC118193654 [Stegodyphus dumicola]
MLYLKSQAYPKISSCNDKSSKGIEDNLPKQEIDKKSAQAGCNDKSSKGIEDNLPKQEIDKKSAQPALSSENSEVKKKISTRNLHATAELTFDFLSPRFKEWYQKVKTEENVITQSKEELISKFSRQNCAHQDLFINENESDGPKIASITSLLTQGVTEQYSSHECLGNTKRETEIGIEMQQNKILADTRTLCEQIMKNNDSESRLLSLRQDDKITFHNQSVVDKTQLASLIEENILFEKLHESISEDERKTECSQNAVGSEIKFSGHEHRRLEIQTNAFPNRKTLNENSLSNFENDTSQENTNFHPIDTFFLLMASTVKKFNLADQHFVKTQVFALVNGMEERYIQQNKKFD